MDLVVAGTEAAVLMVESEAQQLSEEVMLGAVVFGHEQGNIAINAIHELVREAGKPVWDWKAPAKDEPLIAKVNALAEDKLRAAYQIRNKQARTQAMREATACDVMAGLKADGVAFDSVGRRRPAVRHRSQDRAQPDPGRRAAHRRPRHAHRAPDRDPQRRAAAHPRLGAVHARRNAGAGRRPRWAPSATRSASTRWPASSKTASCSTTTCLPSPPAKPAAWAPPSAAKSATAAWPSARWWRCCRPRKSSPTPCAWSREITESNGSSSMASVCGGCLSLMDAGVPMKAHVAGIAMGLIKEGNRFAVLTDILGDEDHLGDMDFKVAGTTNGITALQMDIKIQGITKEIMQVALAQAKEARMHILGKMQEAMGEAKTEVSNFAPRLYTMKINPEKIRDVIGKGGAVIRALTEETGTQINIDEDGTITIASTDPAKADEAKKRIEQITAEVEIGKVYEGPITKILDFGALVNLLPGKDGLLHISQIAHERVEKVTDYLTEGQIVKVKVLETDEKGRVKLSMKALLRPPGGTQRRPHRAASRGVPRAPRPRDARVAWRRSQRQPRELAAPARSQQSADACHRDQQLGAPEVLRLGERPTPCRRRRGADPRRGQRHQPARRAAAHRQLPGAARRLGHSRPGSGRHRRWRRRRRRWRRPASRWATASARWWPAAATPNCAWRRWPSACRCPRA